MQTYNLTTRYIVLVVEYVQVGDSMVVTQILGLIYDLEKGITASKG
jgi:hypothetical protein